MTKKSSAEETEIQGKIQRNTELEQLVQEPASHLAALHAWWDSWVPLEDLPGGVLYGPCGCRRIVTKDGYATDSSRCNNRKWRTGLDADVAECDRCRFQLTAIAGKPIRFTPCPKHRAMGFRPNWCWTFPRGKDLPQDKAHIGSKDGYWPKLEPPREGERLVIGSVCPQGSSLFNVVGEAAQFVFPLCFLSCADGIERPRLNNPERAAHNQEVTSKGRCTRPGCLHNEPEGFSLGERTTENGR